MRIAWFTPFNPNSAIGHYSETVVQELAKTDDVVIYASDAPGRPTSGRLAWSPCRTATATALCVN